MRSTKPDLRPHSELHTSQRGKGFIFTKEAADPEITKHTHWPGYASGVTIGPGYDTKFRTQEQIVCGLMSIGVAKERAQVLAAAGKLQRDSRKPGLTGKAAKEFAERHAKDVTLTLAQQKALLDQMLPAYEADIRRFVHVPLTQNQFDALVSFDYNKGAKYLQEIAPVLNKGDYEHAARILEHFDDKGPPGVRMRRYAEAAKFRFSAPGDQ
ncbi:MAG TPA: glycoside hydrolase family protein [Acetobacteraceae bacterium]|nr:glycoside hydrolase family protein [Acetobacteraceae bacterium]